MQTELAPKGGVDCRGVPISYHDQRAIEGLERAHHCSLVFRGDAIAEIDKVLAEHPQFIMAHLFRAAWMTQAMETRIYDEMVRSFENAAALSARANNREMGHLAAVKKWINGDFYGAVQVWEDVLTRYPRDLIALQLAHLSHVLLGDVAGQRDTVGRVFALWDETIPGYEFVLGFYSFGLEENGDYHRAEEMGREALAMRPDNPYAVHAVSHVMEMKGRQHGGMRFMKDGLKHWGSSNFANHLWWHTSLFHTDIGDIDGVLEIYDNHLVSADISGEKYEELDASALLWRLKLLGVDLGDRWQHLAKKWAPSATDTLYAFNDVHAMMAFVSAGRMEEQEKLLFANERYCESAGDANAAMSREIGMPFCLAIRDFHLERYGQCVDRLLPVRYMTHRLGGSFAQRDVIGWTLLEAALRARRFDLALALANERCALKPTSAQNWRYVARAFRGLGDKGRGDRAEAKSLSLMAA
ncbi:tetratricopeptide repeat protein [Rhodobacteraceae bacterium NNCM2]|nr:tetratricopeptide repeat protein [Coraliihabitans acroporae]